MENTAFLKIDVGTPNGTKTVTVNAWVDPYPFFGCLAQLGRDVLDMLGMHEGQEREGWGDDSGPTNETGTRYTWLESVAKISFKKTKVTGPVVLQLNGNHSVVFKHFLDKIPADETLEGFTTPIYTIPANASRVVTKRVFLSHSHQDKPFCRNLARLLRRNGIYVWLDEAEIKIGESLIEKLQQALSVRLERY